MARSLRVDAAYQMKNVAPEIEQVEITPLNYKFPRSIQCAGLSQSLGDSARARASHAYRSATTPPSADSGSSPALTYAKGNIGVRWLANDDNGDSCSSSSKFAEPTKQPGSL